MVAEFLSFAHVMQHGPTEQEVQINVRVMRGQQSAKLAERKRMFQEPTQPSMMEDLCGRSLLEFRSKTLVHENVHQEFTEMRILDRIHDVQELLKHFFYILSSSGK